MLIANEHNKKIIFGTDDINAAIEPLKMTEGLNSEK